MKLRAVAEGVEATGARVANGDGGLLPAGTAEAACEGVAVDDAKAVPAAAVNALPAMLPSSRTEAIKRNPRCGCQPWKRPKPLRNLLFRKRLPLTFRVPSRVPEARCPEHANYAWQPPAPTLG